MPSYTPFTILAFLTTSVWSASSIDSPARAGELAPLFSDAARVRSCESLRETLVGVASPPPNALTDAEKRDGWELLFDGRITQGWHSYRQNTLNPQWHVEDGLLTTTGKGGGDIVTDRKFDDFELELEWKIDSGGNSGIFYRVDEAAPVIWQLAPEMQVLDDERHVDGRNPKHRAGAVYDLYAPCADVARPAGEFNTVRILANGGHVEHWLNGHKTAEYDTASEDWKSRFAASKFAGTPGFAAARAGAIGLQDHGDQVWFRNIKIRPLARCAESLRRNSSTPHHPP